jgi:hypothetical protein
VKKLILFVVCAVLAVGVDAATVVLQGGKRVDVSRFERRGNYFILTLPNGGMVSYPVAAVDVPATDAAAGITPASSQPTAPSGPHSPFFKAQATNEKSALTITDSDVQHIAPIEGGGEPPSGAAPGGAMGVVLVGYEKKQVEPGTWEITATIANHGANPARAINANVQLADKDGQVVGSGTTGYPGELKPGEQGVVTARVAAQGEPSQVSFDFKWQEVKAVPKAGGEAGGPGTTAPPQGTASPAAEASGGGETPAPGWEAPAGSSPTAGPGNPMAVPPVTAPPAETAPQVPRPTPAPQ